IGGAVFVAGFFKRLTNLEEGEEPAIADEWLTTPIDLQKVKARIPKSVAIFSDDDPFVPEENQEAFRDVLGSEIIVEHAQGHFSGPTDKKFELPIALEA